MALASPVDREFLVMERGFIRDRVILANFRAGLRQQVNPRTGQLFTEDEIARATRPGSRWYVEAEAIDDYGQGRQRNALWLADQIRAERASSRWLVEYHGRPRGLEPLPATGGSGTVQIDGTPGTLVVGSTQLGSPSAHIARDPAGNIYQAFETAPIANTGRVVLLLHAVSTGANTNIPPGTTLTWIRRDPNMAPTCRVVGERFRGGTDRETDAEYLDRILSDIRYKPAAGNDAQVRSWARQSSNAVEEGFVYPCAFHAGSVVIALTAKRGTGLGPLARFPNAGVLSQGISYLTPPLSPVMPSRSFVVVLDPNPEPTDLQMRLSLPRGSEVGWLDPDPFPSFHTTAPSVTSVTSQTDFVITCLGDPTLPASVPGATLVGAEAPAMMIWDDDRSRFSMLPVASVEDLGGNQYRVILSSTPGTDLPGADIPGNQFQLQAGQLISPATVRHEVIALAIEEYFDELGPGQLFDVESDSRGGRCIRFPDVADERGFRAGSVVASRVIEALGGSAANSVLERISKTEPSYPATIMDGPHQLTLGKVGIYHL